MQPKFDQKTTEKPNNFLKCLLPFLCVCVREGGERVGVLSCWFLFFLLFESGTSKKMFAYLFGVSWVFVKRK